MSKTLRISIIITDPSSRILTLKENSIELPAWARWTRQPTDQVRPVSFLGRARTFDDYDAEIEITPSAGGLERPLRFAYKVLPSQQQNSAQAVDSLTVSIGMNSRGELETTADNIIPNVVAAQGNQYSKYTKSHTFRWFDAMPLSMSDGGTGMQARAGIPHFIIAVVANSSIPGYSRIDESPDETRQYIRTLFGDVVVLSVSNTSGRTVKLTELLDSGKTGTHPMTVIPLPASLPDGAMGTGVFLLYPDTNRAIVIDDDDKDTDDYVEVGKAVLRFGADDDGSMVRTNPLSLSTGGTHPFAASFGTGFSLHTAREHESWTDTGELVAEIGIRSRPVFPQPDQHPMRAFQRLVDIRQRGAEPVQYHAMPRAIWFYRPVLGAAPGTALARSPAIAPLRALPHRLNIVNETLHHRLKLTNHVEAGADGKPIAWSESYPSARIVNSPWADPGNTETDDDNGKTRPLAAFPLEIVRGKSLGLGLRYPTYLLSRSVLTYQAEPSFGYESEEPDAVDVDLSLAPFDTSAAITGVPFRLTRPSASGLELQYVDVLSLRYATGAVLDRRNSLVVLRKRESQQTKKTPAKPLLVVFKVYDPREDGLPLLGVELLSAKTANDTALGAGTETWKTHEEDDEDDDPDQVEELASVILMAIPGRSPFGFSARLRAVDRASNQTMVEFDINADMSQVSPVNGIYRISPSGYEHSTRYQVTWRTETVTDDYEVAVVLVSPATIGTPDEALYRTRFAAVLTGIEPDGAGGSTRSTGTNNTTGGTNNTRQGGS